MIQNDRSSIFMVDRQWAEAMIAAWSNIDQDRHFTI